MAKPKQTRNRGVVLTAEGLKKLQSARLNLESRENFGGRYTYEQLSEIACLDTSTIKKVLAVEEPVDKRSLEKFLIAFDVELNPSNYTKARKIKRQDWSEAVSIDRFFGRTEELKTLKSWLLKDRCRLVALLGMGGIGKTTLSIKLAEQIDSQYDYIIWKSLRDAPPVAEIIGLIVEFIAAGKATAATFPKRLGEQITCLIEYLRINRCLILLDNAESLLDGGGRAGKYRSGYEGYSELLKRVGTTEHNSSVILTSREKSQEIALLEGAKLPVRSLQLEGLNTAEGQEIFKIKGIEGSESELNSLRDRYSGNPLAIKVVATTIQDLFGGNISEFLKQEQAVFGDIRDILDQQFERLSNLEQEIMYWLAIAREPISLAELRADFVVNLLPIKLLEALESLSRRSLIENSDSGFTQQPVVMEYVTSKLIEVASQEIITQRPQILRDHALMKATAKDYIRENQIRLIVQPILGQLFAEFRSKKAIEACLRSLIVTMQETHPQEKWYTAGNILNLFCQLETDLTGNDFSNLCIWQADLRQAQLHQVNFQNSDLSKSIFAENFGGIWSVAFSPDGKYLAAGDTKGNILLRRVADGQPIRSYEGHNAWVVSLAFSPDGKTLASSSCDCTAKLWDIDTGQCLHSLDNHKHEVWSVAFSPDGQILATGCDDGKARLWDLNTGKCLQVLSGHESEVLCVTFSFDGKYLVSGSEDKTIKLWHLKSGKCQKVFQGHQGGIRSVDINIDGSQLVSGSNDQTVRLWDFNTGKCLQVFPGHDGMVMSVAFVLKGNYLASSSNDETVRLWDLKAQECVKVLWGHTSYINSVDFTLNSNLLVSGSNDETVRLWDLDTYTCLKTFRGYCNQTKAIAHNLDGTILFTGGHDNTIKLWNLQNEQIIKTLYGHTDWIFSLTYSANSNLLASGSKDKTIRLWDINTGKIIKTLRGHESEIKSVAFSPDGQLLASSSHDKTIRLWDVKTGMTLRILQKHQDEIWSVVFAPNGQILASASLDGTIKLWNVITGQHLKTLNEHTTWVLSVAFSPDGQTLVSTSGDQTIKFWNINTGNCQKTFQEDIGYSQLVAFSPDGQIIATFNGEHTIKLWQVDTEKCLQVLSGHTALINSLNFNPDGRTLVSSSEDETIKLWDIQKGECFKTIVSKNIYAEMNIENVTGLTEATVETIKTMGSSY